MRRKWNNPIGDTLTNARSILAPSTVKLNNRRSDSLYFTIQQLRSDAATAAGYTSLRLSSRFDFVEEGIDVTLER